MSTQSNQCAAIETRPARDACRLHFGVAISNALHPSRSSPARLTTRFAASNSIRVVNLERRAAVIDHCDVLSTGYFEVASAFQRVGFELLNSGQIDLLIWAAQRAHRPLRKAR